MQKDYDNALRVLEEGMEITKELGDRRILVTVLSTLGSVAFEKGDFPVAANRFRESLMISHEVGDKYTMAKCFEGFADMLINLKTFDQAAILSAKYFSLLESSRKNLIEGELDKIDTMKKAIKENISDEDFEKYWKEGEAMSNEQGIEYVMKISERLSIPETSGNQ